MFSSASTRSPARRVAITAVIAAIPLPNTVACEPPSSEASVSASRVKPGLPERV
jgi:hypothetical protein